MTKQKMKIKANRQKNIQAHKHAFDQINLLVL